MYQPNPNPIPNPSTDPNPIPSPSPNPNPNLNPKQAYAQAGWYAYPSDKPETSGIALMKAQACGAVPITSGQLASALPETVGSWDLGPTPRHGKIGIEPEWQQDYVHALLQALRRPADEMARYRQAMKAAARERFSWAAVAALTLTLTPTLTLTLTPTPTPNPNPN